MITSMSPYQINLGTKQLMEKINCGCEEYSWTELTYFIKKLQAEILRLEKFMYFPNCPLTVQNELNDVLIPQLKNTIEKVNSVLETKTPHQTVGMLFSDLTERLNHINRCE